MVEAVDDDEAFYLVELPYPRPQMQIFNSPGDALLSMFLVSLILAPLLAPWIWLGVWLYRRLHMH